FICVSSKQKRDLALRLAERKTFPFEKPQILNCRCDHAGKFLRLARPRIMVRPPIGKQEVARETAVTQKPMRLAQLSRSIQGCGAGARALANWVMAKIDVERRRRQTSCPRQRGKMRREFKNICARIKPQADKIEFYSGERSIEIARAGDFNTKAAGCNCGRNGESERIGAALEIAAGHCIGGVWIRMVHPLRDLPRPWSSAQGPGALLCRAGIERLNFKSFEGGGNQALNGSAAKSRFNAATPFGLAGLRKW